MDGGWEVKKRERGRRRGEHASFPVLLLQALLELLLQRAAHEARTLHEHLLGPQQHAGRHLRSAKSREVGGSWQLEPCFSYSNRGAATLTENLP